MFTGIVEEKGTLKGITHKKNLIVLKIDANKILKGTRPGDSIAVDGACLTASHLKNRTLTFDVMQETILRTTLKYLKPHRQVNLERSLKAGSRIGGHFVFGHVDGVGTIKKKIARENYLQYDIVIDKKLMPYIVPKGSIAIDGISLTVGKVEGNYFSVYIIPHTLKVTTLHAKKERDKVNVETDILAKYILRQK